MQSLSLLTGEVPVLNVSYKPQKISPKSTVSVAALIFFLKKKNLLGIINGNGMMRSAVGNYM